jgi:hypothetical protein
MTDRYNTRDIDNEYSSSLMRKDTCGRYVLYTEYLKVQKELEDLKNEISTSKVRQLS